MPLTEHKLLITSVKAQLLVHFIIHNKIKYNIQASEARVPRVLKGTDQRSM